VEGQRINAFMVEKIIGSKVINLKGETLGKIENLVIDIDTGRIVYAVLESGGFWASGISSFPSLGNPLQLFHQKAVGRQAFFPINDSQNSRRM
jgi:sporulation protein YlmC with PRC-barrel domain